MRSFYSEYLETSVKKKETIAIRSHKNVKKKIMKKKKLLKMTRKALKNLKILHWYSGSDGGAWRAAVCGVAQSRTRLKRRSSSSTKKEI